MEHWQIFVFGIVLGVAISGWLLTAWRARKWNPPKSKTVMIELLREDAEKLVSYGMTIEGIEISKACGKALEAKA